MPKKEIRAGGAVVDTSRVATPLEIVAIAGAFKGTAIKAAKKSLKEDSHQMVNMTVEIVGSIAKSGGIADGEMVPPKVNLTKLPTTCAVLEYLGIGPKRLREALMATGEIESDDEDEFEGNELATVFEEVSREIASTLPPVPAKGVSPKVTSVLSCRVIKSL